MKNCKNCNELIRSDSQCNCKEYLIVDEDGDEYKIFALSAREAAEKFALKSNEANEYYLLHETARIRVDGVYFTISAQPDIHYSAEKL